MKICCLGSGLYSIGIARLLSDKDHDIWMWTHDKGLISSLEEQLPNIHITADLLESIKDAHIILVLVSSTFFIDTIGKLINKINDKTIIYIGTKGLTKDYLYTDYTKKLLNTANVYFFAGPTLAKDIQNKKAVGFSSENIMPLKEILPNYVSLDKIDNSNLLEIAAVYKNIIAIGSGLIMGLTNSYSTVLSYLTKAFKDFYLEEDKNNILSYGIMGDFYLTGTMIDSRNYQFGQVLTETPLKIQNFLQNNTVEGYQMLPVFQEYLINHNKKSLIINYLYQIVYENYPLNTILNYLARD